jgi:hypothetical protein
MIQAYNEKPETVLRFFVFIANKAFAGHCFNFYRPDDFFITPLMILSAFVSRIHKQRTGECDRRNGGRSPV